jgi:hypothetical protein
MENLKEITLSFKTSEFSGYGIFLESQGFIMRKFEVRKKRVTIFERDNVEYIVNKQIGAFDEITTIILKEYTR